MGCPIKWQLLASATHYMQPLAARTWVDNERNRYIAQLIETVSYTQFSVHLAILDGHEWGVGAEDSAEKGSVL